MDLLGKKGYNLGNKVPFFNVKEEGFRAGDRVRRVRLRKSQALGNK